LVTSVFSRLNGLQSEDANEVFSLLSLVAFREASGRSSINLEPALMTYLDQPKQQSFTREWESAVIQNQ
jgi:iron(III) transport system substrate-binding protein